MSARSPARRSVWVVQLVEEPDGLHLFDDFEQAREFLALEHASGHPGTISQEPIFDHAAAGALLHIAAAEP